MMEQRTKGQLGDVEVGFGPDEDNTGKLYREKSGVLCMRLKEGSNSDGLAMSVVVG